MLPGLVSQLYQGGSILLILCSCLHFLYNMIVLVLVCIVLFLLLVQLYNGYLRMCYCHLHLLFRFLGFQSSSYLQVLMFLDLLHSAKLLLLGLLIFYLVLYICLLLINFELFPVYHLLYFMLFCIKCTIFLWFF